MYIYTLYDVRALLNLIDYSSGTTCMVEGIVTMRTAPTPENIFEFTTTSIYQSDL
jgi:hypothetical protein